MIFQPSSFYEILTLKPSASCRFKRSTSILMMEELPLLKDEFYPKILLESFCEMRKSGALCDVILVCDGEIQAHRVILSAASPYFRGMFSHGLKESKEERIAIESLDGDVLRAAVDFMYSGELKAPDDVILPLLEASALLQIGSLRSACMQKLVQSATPYSTFGSCGNLANKLGMLELANFFHRLTIENFEMVAFGDNKQQWLDASFEDISALLCHFSIVSHPAILVLKAVLEWILNDATGGRVKHLKALSHIVKNVNKYDLEKELKGLLIHQPDIYNQLLSHYQQSDPINQIICIKELQVVLIIGGRVGESSMKTVECYIAHLPTSSSWTLYLPDNSYLQQSGSSLKSGVIKCVVPPMNYSRVYAASAFLDNEIYVIGGESDKFPMKTEASVECYNIVLNAWRSVPGIPLPEDLLTSNRERGEGDFLRLLGAAAAFVEGDLYVCGGKLEIVKEGELECDHPPTKWMVLFGLSRQTWVYNEHKGTWRECSPMLKARAYHGAASVNGVLYAVGGISAPSDEDFAECLDSVERFDPWVGEWRRVKSMPSPRSYFGCVTYGHLIYVIGGHDLECCKDTVFTYDTISDTWCTVEYPLRTPVYSVASCALKYPMDTLRNTQTHSFILGGRNSHSGIRDANIYNFTTNRWHCLQSLIHNRYGACAGILRLPIYDPCSS